MQAQALDVLYNLKEGFFLNLTVDLRVVIGELRPLIRNNAVEIRKLAAS